MVGGSAGGGFCCAKSVNGFIKIGLGNLIAYQLIVGANLTFNTIKQTIGWTLGQGGNRVWVGVVDCWGDL